MFDLLRHEPWLIVVVLGLLIPILAIVFGTTTSLHVRRSRNRPSRRSVGSVAPSTRA
jgi:hypothetical protein